MEEIRRPVKSMIDLCLNSGLLRRVLSNEQDLDEDELPKIRKIGQGSIHSSRKHQEIPDSLRITHYGFKFLLLSRHRQIWTLLIHYLQSRSLENAEIDEAACTERLCLIFQLAFLIENASKSEKEIHLKLGDSIKVCYNLQHCTKIQQAMIKEFLSPIGLIYILPRDQSIICPTPAIKHLLLCSADAITYKGHGSSIAELPQSENHLSKSLNLFIESNYHVYAYTSSTLYISMLALFINTRCQFPGFLSGVLDKESCQAAFRHGITADQIIDFLTCHAHPKMKQDAFIRNQVATLPITLTDQIKLWEMDLHRIVLKPAYIYHKFVHTPEYDKALEYACKIGGVLIAIPEKRLIVMTKQGHEQLFPYMTSLKQNHK